MLAEHVPLQNVATGPDIVKQVKQVFKEHF
jgi:hypothetical protein